METREARRDRSWRHGLRARRDHLRLAHHHYGCVCERTVWFFAKRRPLGCDCRRRAPGRPKLGRGVCAIGYRPAVRARIEGARLCRAWARWAGAPDDCEL